MKSIQQEKYVDQETYGFIRDCGIKALLLIKLDTTIGPYIAFKGVYEQNVHGIESLCNPEYLAQFYIGFSGTQMDLIEDNGERIIIVRNTDAIDSRSNPDVLLLWIDENVSRTAVIKFAKDLLKKTNAEPSILEETITNLREVMPTLQQQLKKHIRESTNLEILENVPKKHKFTRIKRFMDPFYFLQKREINEIELGFPILQKSMFFIRIPLERSNISRFFTVFLSNIVIDKKTIFSIDIKKGNVIELGLSLLLPLYQRNFVERLTGALTMAGFPITILRDKEMEEYWLAPLETTKDTTLRISRKHKDFIQVHSSPPRFITLFKSTHINPFTIGTLIQAINSMYATILCRGTGKNNIAVEIVLTKLHFEKAEMNQFSLPGVFIEHFKKVSGRRELARTVKTLLLRKCAKGTKMSLQELKKFSVGDIIEDRMILGELE